MMRQDPPFDMAYITATHLLEHIQRETLVVNDPISVRNAPEKLYVTHFAELMPPTLIATDPARIVAFREKHGDIIVKPLFGNGGAGVFHIAPGDENLTALLEVFTELYHEPIVVQKYLPEVREGDKRIILIDGEPAGAVNRVPPKGESRANLHVGGRAEKSALTARDREICEAIGPALVEDGLVFVGIDVIGGYLTEINVTSPTGLQEINRFDGVKLESGIWDAVERRHRAHHSGRPT
jgi:glutathione synthase